MIAITVGLELCAVLAAGRTLVLALATKEERAWMWGALTMTLVLAAGLCLVIA